MGVYGGGVNLKKNQPGVAGFSKYFRSILLFKVQRDYIKMSQKTKIPAGAGV